MTTWKKRAVRLMLCVCLILLLSGCGAGKEETFFEGSMTETEAPASETDTAKETEDARETEAKEIYVDVCGAVKHPGVYVLKEGDRVFTAIELAGGLLRDADVTMLNQAGVVTDGSKIYVYTKEEAKEAAEKGAVFSKEGDQPEVPGKENDRVNLNTADAETLTTLAGIGTSRAEDIIAYRTEHGGFKTIEEIMNVTGIKDATFQKIKDKIVVE